MLWIVEQNLDGKLIMVELSTLDEVSRRFPKSLPISGVYLLANNGVKNRNI
jgi:hypothetical protein